MNIAGTSDDTNSVVCSLGVASKVVPSTALFMCLRELHLHLQLICYSLPLIIKIIVSLF